MAAGSDDAAREVATRFAPRVLMEIRKYLGAQIRSKFDSDDFLQDVWASFFAEPKQKRAFGSRAQLMAFLTRMAQNKVIDVMRQRTRTQKYNVNREKPIDDSKQFDKSALAGTQATPSQILMSEEEWEEFLKKQPVAYRRIFILLREGKTQMEIAEELDLDPRTVSRALSRLNREPPQ